MGADADRRAAGRSCGQPEHRRTGRRVANLLSRIPMLKPQGEEMQTSRLFTGVPMAQLTIASDVDVVAARRRGRSVATAASFAPADVTLVAAVISELARNIVLYAKRGEITIQLIESGDQRGIRIEASDEGPGIADVEGAMEIGYSTSGSAGLGLPAVRRVMDEFYLHSVPSRGTRVIVTKWRT